MDGQITIDGYLSEKLNAIKEKISHTGHRQIQKP